ncbi:diphosphate--fructose-6-phosphate 1-phosphotransferase [Tuanshanicoccus lijuaniae]|uniref:diphosphate--fructose-6-phosphate 1-phosphotransferase n=1 Tax=Aerococcaceae bacterium zg-1292 TaxID=2774330 RepID=UPI00193693E3|nr:diphosphate--fructose-6-phosphate 1-phosphotransferase [Aerococcaceae bacterium zg-1292]MBF6978201.1 diphosphate--fructose-6-phosphate 1-phosphotransferase [Aerococcaceae bacterium zg-BR22]MBS4456419.1 diphosphate--fructose-6-phosphate 1-phosphotransferase [Aerococcaceae bacterium zg-A91]MBS4458269.1 diphosphate--fructose-6-phosphate 1-phosphotransferase [Aerococcaceae bacterium zg-BR33]QQA37499.1 diphosphate--fructose-6-phosphate 1-phosphotransferase [Aerococcaceae bacterium zg-1292]
MGKNILVLHGGGPTAVINSSLYGVLKECRKHTQIRNIYAAKNGTGGLLREELIDLSNLELDDIEKLKQTPGTAIGTSRDQLSSSDYNKMVQILIKHNIHYVLFNGGNGTMDACGKLYEMCKKLNVEISVIGIPKTMDNDLSITDHSPGFASAAQYIAQSVREVCFDVHSLPIHVVVIETSGRNAGWITASSALADINGPYKPDLIYLPEVPFSEEKFLNDVKNVLNDKKGVVVVVSEGLKNFEGNPIVEPIFSVGRATYFGDVSSHLANLIIKKIGYKARGEKPGLLGRASIALQSSLDTEEAILVGMEAVKAVVRGESGKMVAIQRKKCEEYEIETILVPLYEVMLLEKTVPERFINKEHNGVTKEFIEWCKPFVSNLPEMISFK